MPLRIGVLSMSDNHSSRALLREMHFLGCMPDAVFFQKFSRKDAWRRVMRKIKAAGLRSTLERILTTLRFRLSGLGNMGTADQTPLPSVVHWVADFNGKECRELIAAGEYDVLLLNTDTMIGRGTFRCRNLEHSMRIRAGYLSIEDWGQ